MDFHVDSKATFFSLEYNPEEPFYLYCYFRIDLLDEPQFQLNNSLCEFKWFPIQEIPTIDLAVPFDKKIIQKAITSFS